MSDNLKAIFLAVLVKWIATAEIFKEMRPMTEPLSRSILVLLILERLFYLTEMWNVPLPWFLRKKKTEEPPKYTPKMGDQKYEVETGHVYIYDGDCWRQW